jgi:hypothetical protein
MTNLPALFTGCNAGRATPRFTMSQFNDSEMSPLLAAFIAVVFLIRELGFVFFIIIEMAAVGILMKLTCQALGLW